MENDYDEESPENFDIMFVMKKYTQKDDTN